MSVGIDIVDISRIEKINKEHFCKKIMSVKERELPMPATESLAGVFAAKEAFSKAVGTGFGPFDFKDISVFHDSKGKPYLEFSKKAQNILNTLGVTSCEVSISHEKQFAVAVVTLKTDIKYNYYINSIKKLMDAPEGCITDNYIKQILKKRKADIHKGDCGRLLIIAGSPCFSGAAVMSANASVRTGAGLVTLAHPKSLTSIFEGKNPEVMTFPLGDTDGYLNGIDTDDICEKAEKSDCVLIGPGLGTKDGILTIVKKIINTSQNIIIDADGINALSKNIDILKGHKSNIILTPHIGEFSRLTGKSCEDVLQHGSEYALSFAKEYNVTVVLKSHKTLIAFPDGKVFRNILGNPGMATGGTGDVLAGCISSFCAQKYSPAESAILGVYIHSLSADMASLDKGEYGLIPSDIIDYLPYAIKYSF